MTTQDDIRRWLAEGQRQNATYVVVVCDTFSYDDYPVYCKDAAECLDRYAKPGHMQKVMEVYDMSMDLEEQIAARRVMNLPKI